MLSNNNKAAVKRLSHRSFNASRGRNVIALIAIILTTFMITSVFSIGVSFGRNFKTAMVRLSGTQATVFLKAPTAAQTEKIKGIDGIKNVGAQINIGSVRQKTAEGKDMSIAILCYDKTEWEEHIIPAVGAINGNYPVNENEIMLSEKALKLLGISAPVVGQKITLTYKSDGGKLTKNFVLSGWYSEYEQLQSGGIALLSQAYCNTNGLTLAENGRICISIKTGYASDVYDFIDQQVKTEGQYLSSSTTLDNESSQGTLMVIISIALIALFIVFSGYLLIYNIMYISVTKDIHFYGLLKTIGTSPKQIKTVVRKQAFRLSVIGIPAGLLLGFLTSFGIVPAAMTMFTADSSAMGSAMPSAISFSPLIFAGTALFALFTVVISCRKPAKIASRVSPVEAVRYTGVTASGRKLKRKSTDGGKLYKMAFHNVFRDKKRAILVFASLFMGTVTFLSVTSFFSSLNVNNYISEYYPDDFSYQSLPPLDTVKFDDDFMASIDTIDEITSKEIVCSEYCTVPFDEKLFEPVLRETYNTYSSVLGVNSYEEFISSMKKLGDKNDYGTRVYGIDNKYVEEYNHTHEDKVDIEAFERGEVCLIGKGNYSAMTGRTLQLTSQTSKNTESIRIGGVLDDSSSCDFSMYAYAVGCVEGVFVSQQFLDSLNPNANIDFINLNTKSTDEPMVRAKLEKLNSSLTNYSYEFTAKSEQAQNFTSTMTTMNILTGGISALLILIGIINFINVMITGVYSRRKELSVLESIGMTKKQIKRMLCLEGFCYALITVLLIMSLGNAVMFFIGGAMPSLADYAQFTYPYIEVSLLVAVIFAICIAVPPIVYKTVNKESVTQRLHNADT